MTYFIVRAAISQQHSVERILELDADELRVQVVESNTGVVVGAVLGADFEVHFHRLRHAALVAAQNTGVLVIVVTLSKRTALAAGHCSSWTSSNSCSNNSNR